MQIFLIRNNFRNTEDYIVAESVVKAIDIYKCEALKKYPHDFDESEITEIKKLGFCLIGE